MGIKLGLNKVFNNYVSNLNSKEHFTEHDSYVLDKIGYLKQVLSGERRKKQAGGFWIWESRIKEAQRVLHNLNKYSLSEEADILNGMFDLTFKNKYFAKKFETAGKDSDLCIISKNIASTIENYFDIYPEIKHSGNIRRETAHRENLETIASRGQETKLAGAGRGKTKLAKVALLAAMGLSLLTGLTIQRGYDNRILYEKEKIIEQLVQKREKPRMIIKTDLPSEEMDKRYEKYAADEKAGRLPVLDLTQNKEDGVEYYTNKLNNKGVFVKGFMYSTNRMQVPAEFDEQELKERAKAKARYAKHVEKARKHILAIPRTGVKMVSDTAKTAKNMSIASYNLTTSLFADKIKRKEKLHDAVDYLKKGLREAVSVFEAPSQIVLEVPTAITYMAGTTPLSLNDCINKGISETGKFLEETIEEMPERKGKFVMIWEWGKKDGFLKSTFATPRDFGKSTIALGTNWFSFKYIWANIIDWFKQNIFGYDNGKVAGTSSVAGGMGRSGGAGTP